MANSGVHYSLLATRYSPLRRVHDRAVASRGAGLAAGTVRVIVPYSARRTARPAGAPADRPAGGADQGHVHPGAPRAAPAARSARRRWCSRRPTAACSCSPPRRSRRRPRSIRSSASIRCRRSFPISLITEIPISRGGARQSPDSRSRRPDRQGQGRARQVHVRLGRRRHRQSSGRRAAQEDGRHRPAARAVPRRLARR